MEKRLVTLLTLGLFILSCTPTQKSGDSPSGIFSLTSYTYQIPILKDGENVIQRVRIYNAGEAVSNLTSLELGLNEAARKNIDSIKIFSTGDEPLFNDKNRLTHFVPVNSTHQIPVDLKLTTGMNYLWLTVKLKQNASMDEKPGLSITSLAISEKGSFAVSNARNLPIFRTGLTLRKAWQNGIHSYRIPAITTTTAGTLLAVYDNRYLNSGDLPGNIDVGMSRSTDGGKTWEPMKVIMDMGPPHENNGIGDPAILFDPQTNTLWVAALWSKGNRSLAGSRPGLSPDTSGQFVLVKSMDDGKTWSGPINITAQVKDPKWHIYFNGPGMGITMQDGTLVFPSQYWDEKRVPHSAIIYSKDKGQSWQSSIGAKSNTTESQVVETQTGTLMLNMRDNRGGFRSIATTTNMGKTWLEHPTSYSALIDPVCMASIIKAKVNVKGKLQDVLFFSNVNSSTARKDMTIKASLDMGQTWLPANELLIDERMSFGYSCLTKIDHNTIGLLYEGVRDLNFVRVPVSEIIK